MSNYKAMFKNKHTGDIQEFKCIDHGDNYILINEKTGEEFTSIEMGYNWDLIENDVDFSIIEEDETDD